VGSEENLKNEGCQTNKRASLLLRVWLACHVMALVILTLAVVFGYVRYLQIEGHLMLRNTVRHFVRHYFDGWSMKTWSFGLVLTLLSLSLCAAIPPERWTAGRWIFAAALLVYLVVTYMFVYAFASVPR